MPNWVPNRLFVSGAKAGIRAFKERVQVKDEKGRVLTVLTFHTIVPIPSECVITQHYRSEKASFRKQYGRAMTRSDMGSFWCMDHWGTKWDAYEPRVARCSPTSLLYTFPTAWSPPTAWVKAASKQFPELRFSLQYWIDGDTTRAIVHIQKGKVKVYRVPELLKDS